MTPKQTQYVDVTTADADVFAFVVGHPYAQQFVRTHNDALQPEHLPVKMWAARENGMIVAVLLLRSRPYPVLDLLVADSDSRPFMRILRLWQMAERWLREHRIPIVCTSPIPNFLAHYQSLVRRFGFEAFDEYCDEHGIPVQTIYVKRFDGVTIQQAETVH